MGWPSVSPNRIETTPASRSDSVSSTECSCSCSSVKLTASPGWIASESSIRSPNSLSPSSPSGVCREIGSPAVLLHLDDLLPGYVQLGRGVVNGPLHPGGEGGFYPGADAPAFSHRDDRYRYRPLT